MNTIYTNNLFYYIDLIPFTNLLELLVINHSSSFVPRWFVRLLFLLFHFCSSVVESLLCSGCFTTCMGAHFSAVDMGNTIRFSIVSGPLEGVRVPVAQLQIILPASPVFQYTSGLEVLAYSTDPDFNNVITMLQSYVHS